MKIAGGIVTDKGGRTCHAAIVAREIGVPAIVGTINATSLLEESLFVTVSCAEGSEGNIYKGKVLYDVEKTDLNKLPKIKTNIMLNVGSPDLAFKFSRIPNCQISNPSESTRMI